MASVTLLPGRPATPTQVFQAPPAVSGTHDQVADDPVPAVTRSDRDLPGRARASLGGGAPGAADSWTGRSDREQFQTQAFSHPTENRLPRHGSAVQASSPERVVRAPERGFDDHTETRARARDGADTPAPGDTSTERPGGAGIPERDPDSDAVAAGPEGARTSQRLTGRIGTTGQALTKAGDPATQAELRSPDVRDTVRMAAASDERDPAPIELSQARAGGDQVGVAGPRPAAGLSARGQGTRGSAASTADATPDSDAGTVRAGRSDPYFRRMYESVDRFVEYPKELALSLRQGEVVVRFELAASGSIAGLRVIKSSGYKAFDQEVVGAVRQAAPFGRVPSALIGARTAVEVLVPYRFSNPLIR